MMDGLLFFAISISVLLQSATIIENLRSNTDEESEAIALFTPGILFIGILLRY